MSNILTINANNIVAFIYLLLFLKIFLLLSSSILCNCYLDYIFAFHYTFILLSVITFVLFFVVQKYTDFFNKREKG